MDNDQLIQQWELEVKEISDTFTCHPSQQRWPTDERWERLEMLGRGGYGEVWLQKCTTDPRVGDLRAVKELFKISRQSSEHTRPNFCYQELSALIKFSHQQYRDYFVSSFGWFQRPKSLFITMQYFPHGDLQSHITRTSSFKKRAPNWWVKLSDFGCSKEATTLRTTVGTPPYWAPELCHIFTHADEESSDCIADQAYSFEVDIWAVGVIAFRLTTGALPFGESPYSKLYRYIRQSAPFPTSSLLTGESKLFSEWLVSRSPGDRPTATRALEHSWISSSPHDLSTLGTIDGGNSGPSISGTSESQPASGRWTTVTAQSPDPQQVQPSDTDTSSGTQISRLPAQETNPST
ncbi:Protein kinase domain-containing protein [Fusarium sp. LHS14.1]|nr:Protein kinase domain-containing protein [Fusarium sp. LHS14.1]